MPEKRRKPFWLSVLFLASGLSCQASPVGPRQSCTGAGDATCPVTQTCLWLHFGEGAGYFCGKFCTDSSGCPSGQTCVTDAGSSCMTCADTVAVCE
jgi:hypothetical protein